MIKASNKRRNNRISKSDVSKEYTFRDRKDKRLKNIDSDEINPSLLWILFSAYKTSLIPEECLSSHWPKRFYSQKKHASLIEIISTVNSKTIGWKLEIFLTTHLKWDQTALKRSEENMLPGNLWTKNEIKLFSMKRKGVCLK